VAELAIEVFPQILDGFSSPSRKERVMRFRGYLYVALATTLNIIVYALTFGRYLWLEGRVRSGIFRNWGRRYRYRTRRFAQPATEAEIVELVRNSSSLRCFGSAHSFNEGVVADDTLVSLDRYSGVVWKDLEKKQLCVRGGTRVRDVARLLLDEGLAFGALPSHDAQSIAGILSTDVHGTGRDWGFVSQWVVSLKLIDGTGNVHECQPSDDLFRAAIGGIGAVGIISEVVIQAFDRFNIEQKVELSNLSFVKSNFDRLWQGNAHLSIYFFPFTDRCQINTWNPTPKKQSFLGPLREFLSISMDALLSAWFGGFMAYARLLPTLSSLAYSFKRGTDLVMESNKGYNRTIYPLHQELEFTVPFEETFEICRRCIRLYEEMYYAASLPYTLFEIRFTPAGHHRTLIGAGRDRRSTWVDIVCNDSHGFERYYAAVEELMKEIGARPHLGKFCKSFRKSDLAKLHQDHFEKFLQLVKEHDPENKFTNEFTRRIFRD
jgi:D-arabinono-1,4-lactone oxidase/FAD binding domain